MTYIIVAMIFYTAALLFIAFASRKIDGTIVSGVSNLLSSVIPLIAAASLINKHVLTTQKAALIYSVIAGICIAIFAIALSKSYAVNKVAIVSPIVFGGAIFLTAVLSSVFFKEKISLVQGIGLTFVLLGLGLVVYARVAGK